MGVNLLAKLLLYTHLGLNCHEREAVTELRNKGNIIVHNGKENLKINPYWMKPAKSFFSCVIQLTKVSKVV